MEYVRYFVIFNRLRRRTRFSIILIISELSTDSIDYFCYLKPGTSCVTALAQLGPGLTSMIKPSSTTP